MGWYEQRWAIEEYFRLLKTGTRIEDRRLREADALVKGLAFDAITAWQVFSLARHARDAPQTPAEDLPAQDERAMIGAFVERRQLRPAAERGKPFGPDIRVGWCCWPAWWAGGPASGSPAQATSCSGGHTCVCRRWCSGCKRCVALDRLCPGVHLEFTDQLSKEIGPPHEA